MQSIFDRIKQKQKERRELTEKERAEVGRKVLDAIHTTGAQREIYAMRAQDAIHKARRAAAANDPTGKALAVQELKLCYGVYRYMGTLNSAYRTLDAQIQMQKITQDFAGVVNTLSSINVSQPTLNFQDLTRKALSGLKGLDLTGMENMVNELVRGTNMATAVETAEDPFWEKLISGEVSLDSDPSAQGAAVPAQTQAAAQPAQTKTGDELIESMLAQLSQGLNNS